MVHRAANPRLRGHSKNEGCKATPSLASSLTKVGSCIRVTSVESGSTTAGAAQPTAKDPRSVESEWQPVISLTTLAEIAFTRNNLHLIPEETAKKVSEVLDRMGESDAQIIKQLMIKYARQWKTCHARSPLRPQDTVL